MSRIEISTNSSGKHHVIYLQGARVFTALLLFVTVACLGVCKSTPDNGQSNLTDGKTTTPDKNGTGETTGKQSGADEITAEDRREGMLSSSSYQVFITAFGATREEARENGLAEAQKKALNLMRKDPELSGRQLSASGLRDLRRMIQNNSKVVKMVQAANGSWSVVLRVEKDDLRSFLKNLR